MTTPARATVVMIEETWTTPPSPWRPAMPDPSTTPTPTGPIQPRFNGLAGELREWAALGKLTARQCAVLRSAADDLDRSQEHYEELAAVLRELVATEVEVSRSKISYNPHSGFSVVPDPVATAARANVLDRAHRLLGEEAQSDD